MFTILSIRGRFQCTSEKYAFQNLLCYIMHKLDFHHKRKHITVQLANTVAAMQFPCKLGWLSRCENWRLQSYQQWCYNHCQPVSHCQLKSQPKDHKTKLSTFTILVCLLNRKFYAKLTIMILTLNMEQWSFLGLPGLARTTVGHKAYDIDPQFQNPQLHEGQE